MKRSRREATRVCFDENPHKIIRASYPQTPDQDEQQYEHVFDDCLWYTPWEIAHFKRQNEQMRQTLAKIDKMSYQNPLSWSAGLRRLHGACCKLATAQDVVQWMQSAPAYPFQDCTLGLERQGIPTISAAVLQRRTEIYAQILELQYSNLPLETKWQRIREASCAVSRASVLYARLLAEIVAATITQRMMVDLKVIKAANPIKTSSLTKSATARMQQGARNIKEDVVLANQAEENDEDDFTPLPF